MDSEPNCKSAMGQNKLISVTELVRCTLIESFFSQQPLRIIFANWQMHTTCTKHMDGKRNNGYFFYFPVVWSGWEGNFDAQESGVPLGLDTDWVMLFCPFLLVSWRRILNGPECSLFACGVLWLRGRKGESSFQRIEKYKKWHAEQHSVSVVQNVLAPATIYIANYSCVRSLKWSRLHNSVF